MAANVRQHQDHTVYSASEERKGFAISCIPSVGITIETTLQ
jgi:hypothetical protein